MLLVSAALVAILAFVYWYKRPNRFPDGPRGLPFVGIIPWISGRNLGEVFMEYQKDYGRIFSFRIGRDDWVVLNKFEDIHEALVRQGAVFSGRPRCEPLNAVSKGKGLALIDYGHFWKVQRKFGINTLRGFGIGKRRMEDNVMEEISHLKSAFLKKKSEPFDPRNLLTNAVSNLMCSIAFGKRFDYEDNTFKKIICIVNKSFTGEYSKYLIFLQAAFWMRHFPYFQQAYKLFLKDYNFLVVQMIEIAKTHQKTYDENDLRDFIDVFIKEMKAGTDPSFEFEQLAQYIRELFEAGSETTASTLIWCILCFLNYPEHQEKIHSEVERIIGFSNPSMEHLSEMPYTAAFIHEIMRHRTMVPSVMHKTTENVEFKGYRIPKNTTIIANSWSVHCDPELFNNPEDFNPQRFIDQEGKFVKSPHVIPFGIGPRQCLGMQLANMEVFIFLTTLVQQFEILPPNDAKIPSFHDGKYGLVFVAKPYKAIFNARS